MPMPSITACRFSDADHLSNHLHAAGRMHLLARVTPASRAAGVSRRNAEPSACFTALLTIVFVSLLLTVVQPQAARAASGQAAPGAQQGVAPDKSAGETAKTPQPTDKAKPENAGPGSAGAGAGNQQQNPYWPAFYIITGLAGAFFLILVIGLIAMSAKGKWSIADALSEEAAYQPAKIEKKEDIAMVPSTSRLIALLGLLGILTIVMGVGYAVIWNLFVYQKVPDLSQVKSFLFGAAVLFAPYLANQVREIFDPSGNGQKGAPGAPAATKDAGQPQPGQGANPPAPPQGAPGTPGTGSAPPAGGGTSPASGGPSPSG